MSGVEAGVGLFALMLALIALRAPVGLAMLIAGMVGYIGLNGWLPLINYLKTAAFYRFSTYELSVIPLFLLMGQFATQAGLSRALFEAACNVAKRTKKKPRPEVMIPLVGTAEELARQAAEVRAVADEVFKKKKIKVPYLIGTKACAG